MLLCRKFGIAKSYKLFGVRNSFLKFSSCKNMTNRKSGVEVEGRGHHSMQLLSRSLDVCSYVYTCFYNIIIMVAEDLLQALKRGHSIKQTDTTDTRLNCPY